MWLISMRMKYHIGVGAIIVVVLMLMSGVCSASPVPKSNTSNKSGVGQFGGGFYGHVYDKNDSSPIAGAVVVAVSLLTYSTYSATTNSAGYYKIDVLIGGPYLLKAKAEGYRTKVTKSFVLSPLYQEVNFYLTKTKDSQQNTPSGDVKKKSGHVEPVKPVTPTKLSRVSPVFRKVMHSKETTPFTNPVFHAVQKPWKHEANSFVKRYSSNIRLHLS